MNSGRRRKLGLLVWSKRERAALLTAAGFASGADAGGADSKAKKGRWF